MKQYKEHLQAILNKGTFKPAARENMPGTISLFGYQWKHDLSEGFPLITTKKVYWKGIVVELLWFLKGDTNVKWLNDNGVTFWNEDAYAYYVKKMKTRPNGYMDFQSFEMILKHDKILPQLTTYEREKFTLGDCGNQYGKLWRDWVGSFGYNKGNRKIDQLKDLLYGLKNNPMSRRHIITAWNPATLDDMALNACHAMVQFNCRLLSSYERIILHNERRYKSEEDSEGFLSIETLDERNIPKYYLDCQMYQRSADMFLGVPLNIASYALLTHILAKICNMIPGEITYTYGDSHIYENHLEQVKEQLNREERELPKLNINTEFWGTESGECGIGSLSIDSFLEGLKREDFLQCLIKEDIQLSNYNPHPPIKGELSTGIKK